MKVNCMKWRDCDCNRLEMHAKVVKTAKKKSKRWCDEKQTCTLLLLFSCFISSNSHTLASSLST